MPWSALSAVCLRSSSIQPCRVSPIIAAWHRPPFSIATWSSQRRTSGSWPCSATKRGSSRRAYGNSTSLTNEMEDVVPSMSVRITVRMAGPETGTGERNPRRAAGGRGGGSGGAALVVARELLRDVGAGEVADPAVGLLEEADRHEVRFRPHVEPVGGAVGHGDQVVLDAFDLVDLVAHVQGEQARALHEKAHLVFLVVVLVEELGAQLILLRVVRADADHVH